MAVLEKRLMRGDKEQDEDARKRRARGVTIARDERREAKSERGERGARDDRWEE